MYVRHLSALLLVLLLAGYACAQVGVEIGLTEGRNAAGVEGLRALGAAIAGSVTGSTSALRATMSAIQPGSTVSVSRGSSGSRSFVPVTAGPYVAGVSWSNPGSVPVVLRAGAQEATGTTAAPLLLHFDAPAGTLCNVSVRATGDVPTEGLAAQLDFVREAQSGESPSKSLLTPGQRLAEITRKGPLPSVLPLLVNLAERHLKGAQPATDLDALFERLLSATPAVTTADLQALVSQFDALPAAVMTESFTARTLALRSLPAPTLAAVAPVFARSGFSGGVTPTPGIVGLEPTVPAGGAYAPGAALRVVGGSLATQPEDVHVYLYAEVPGRYTTRPLSVAAASPTALVFQLPADLPEGRYHLSITSGRKSASLASAIQVSKTGVSSTLEQVGPAPAAHYRLSLLRLECVDETNPEWWGNDDVMLLLSAVGDGQVVTRATGPLRDFSDGGTQAVPEGDRQILTNAQVTQGMGLAVELWRWNPPAPATGVVGEWALREALANALAAPEPQFRAPKPQADVAAELAVCADPVGYQQLTWTAAELRQLLQPGQKLDKVVELRQGDKPEDYDASGCYKLTLELERLD